MSWIRGFTGQEGVVPPERNIDQDAPVEMRHELIDLIFHLFEEAGWDVDHVYHVICQSLGRMGAGQPYGGVRRSASRTILEVSWERVYDLVLRMWPEFRRAGLLRQYMEGTNRILGSYGIVWELTPDGRLRRVLPPTAQEQVESAFRELGVPRFREVLELFIAARDAFDDRARRDRDTCANIFAAMEAIAKQVCGLANETFHGVLQHLRRNNRLQPHIIGTLEALNTLRNRQFGHGTPFTLNPAEVDFTYLACVGGVLLFARLP